MGALLLTVQPALLQDPDEEDAEEMDTAVNPSEVRTGAAVETGQQARDEGLKPADIDAYWLQRNITKAYGSLDENDAVQKTEEAFNALQVCCAEISKHNGFFFGAISAA